MLVWTTKIHKWRQKFCYLYGLQTWIGATVKWLSYQLTAGFLSKHDPKKFLFMHGCRFIAMVWVEVWNAFTWLQPVRKMRHTGLSVKDRFLNAPVVLVLNGFGLVLLVSRTPPLEQIDLMFLESEPSSISVLCASHLSNTCGLLTLLAHLKFKGPILYPLPDFYFSPQTPPSVEPPDMKTA